jgi:hypothetical protein
MTDVYMDGEAPCEKCDTPVNIKVVSLGALPIKPKTEAEITRAAEYVKQYDGGIVPPLQADGWYIYEVREGHLCKACIRKNVRGRIFYTLGMCIICLILGTLMVSLAYGPIRIVMGIIALLLLFAIVMIFTKMFLPTWRDLKGLDADDPASIASAGDKFYTEFANDPYKNDNRRDIPWWYVPRVKVFPPSSR